MAKAICDGCEETKEIVLMVSATDGDSMVLDRKEYCKECVQEMQRQKGRENGAQNYSEIDITFAVGTPWIV